jgi:pilus assembly protein CpaB
MLARLILLGLALLVGTGTALGTRAWVRDERARATGTPEALGVVAPPPATQRVLVAAREIRTGQFIREDDLRWQEWLASGVLPGYATEGKRRLEDWTGAVARTALQAGEPLTAAKAVKPGDRSFLSVVLGPDLRAVSVPVTAASGIAGLAFPGDRVDVVLGARNEGMGADQELPAHYAVTVVRDVRLLAVDQKLDNTKGEAAVGKTATLELTARQVEAVTLAMQMGQLSLSLRSLAVIAPAGSSEVAEGGMTDRDIAPAATRRKPAPPIQTPPVTPRKPSSGNEGGARSWTVTVMRAGEAKEQVFER